MENKTINDLIKDGLFRDTNGQGVLIYVDKRQDIKDSFNNSSFGALNVQGDDVRQQNLTISNQEQEKAFSDLFAYIDSLTNQSEKEQAQYNAEELKASIIEGDTTKAQKFFKFLQNSLGNIAALATIAQVTGLPVPPLF